MEQTKNPIHFYVDGVTLETFDSTLTPAQIIERAGKDPHGRFLLLDQAEGQDALSYEDAPHVHIPLKEGVHFTTAVKAHEVKLTIVTPVGKWPHAEFVPATTIRDVVEATFSHFDGRLNRNDPYEVFKEHSEVALPPEQTLKALGIKSGDVLVLVKSTVGGGK